jgi:hypothetical protein
LDVLKKQLKGVIEINVIGDKTHIGVMVDSGQDIVVLYNGVHFIYIPFAHVQNITPSPQSNPADYPDPPEHPIDSDKEISYRKMLMNSKGVFSEIYVSGNQSIHGYITHIMTNYFQFYSPVYRTMFIPLFHLKWLIPYNSNQTPYLLEKKFLPVHPSDLPLSRSFEEQLKKLEGKMVVFDLGGSASKIGHLNKLENNIAELVTAEGKRLFTNIQHIKTVHSPNM